MTDIKVDISSLYKINIDQLAKMAQPGVEQKLAEVLEGTDLQYDPATHNVQLVIPSESDPNAKPQVKSLGSISQFVKQIQELKAADSSKDQFLDEGEINQFLSNKGNKQTAIADFAAVLAERIEKSYGVIADNLNTTKTDFLISLLREYSEGIRDDDIRQAHESFRSNNLTKSLVNFVPGTVSIGYWEPGDRYCDNKAKERVEEREKAIQELENIFKEGIKAKADWAEKSELKTALEKLGEKHPKYKKLLEEDLVAPKIYEIFSMEVPVVEEGDEKKASSDKAKFPNLKDEKIAKQKERIHKILEFAKGELSTFLGYGGGNSSALNRCNYTGKHNNVSFARLLLRSLYQNRHTDDVTLAKETQDEAFAILEDIYGQGGDIWNLVTVGGFSGNFKKWSEEEKIGAVGQGAVTGVTLYLSIKGVGAIRDVSALSPLSKTYGGWKSWRTAMREEKGFAAVWKTWVNESRIKIPIPERLRKIRGLGFLPKAIPIGGLGTAYDIARAQATKKDAKQWRDWKRWPLSSIVKAAKTGEALEEASRAQNASKWTKFKGWGARWKDAAYYGPVFYYIDQGVNERTNASDYYKIENSNREFDASRVIGE